MVRVSVDRITRNEFSVIKITDEEVYKYQLLVQHYGQMTPIIVCSTPHLKAKKPDELILIDNELAYKAIRSLGLAEIDAINVGVLTDTEMEILHLKLNLLKQDIDEAELAFSLGRLSETINESQLCNQLNLKKSQVEHYLALYNFMFENYIKQDTNQASLF